MILILSLIPYPYAEERGKKYRTFIPICINQMEIQLLQIKFIVTSFAGRLFHAVTTYIIFKPACNSNELYWHVRQTRQSGPPRSRRARALGVLQFL